MYQLMSDPNSVLRLEDSATIPFAEGNRDYEEYLQWLSEGNIPQPLATSAPDRSKIAQAALDALEQSTLMNRLTREFMLVSMQDMANRQSQALAAQNIVKSPQQILSDNIGWQKLSALDAQAIALREQM